MKVMTSTSEFYKEVVAMKRISRKALSEPGSWGQPDCPVPEAIASGFLFQLNDELKAKQTFEEVLLALGRPPTLDDLKEIGKVNPYIVMPRYGKNLSDFFLENELNFSLATILDIGQRVLQQLQAVHRAGYIYNDLKPDNIML